jgi:uncharacterized protein (TIGR02118 family)
MYKVVWFARFTPDRPKAESGRHWAEVHGPLFAQVPGVERYVQSHVVGPLPGLGGTPGDPPHFDGYSCAWFTDREAFEAGLRSPEWAAVGEDSDNAFDGSWFEGMSAHVREVTQIEGPDTGPYKAVWVVSFREDLDRAAADEHWATDHGPLFRDVPIDRYLQNHVVAGIDRTGESAAPTHFDGFSECWFADEGQLLEALATPGWAAARDDNANVFDVSRMWRAALREVVVKELQAA